MPESFATVLRRCRDRSGVPQKSLAQQVGLSPSMIALLELAERRPTRQQILRIATALALTATEADELLLAGGQLPSVYDRISPADPDLLLLADVLGDLGIPEQDKLRLRLLLRLECQRWRPEAFDLRDGSVIGRGERE